jgi:hypothetical protein
LVGMQISEHGIRVITRGDAMLHRDPAASSELLGRVTRVQRGGFSFIPSSRVSLVRSVAAWILCRSGRCRSLAMRFHATRLSGVGCLAGSSDSYARTPRTLDVSVPPHP